VDNRGQMSEAQMGKNTFENALRHASLDWCWVVLDARDPVFVLLTMYVCGY